MKETKRLKFLAVAILFVTVCTPLFSLNLNPDFDFTFSGYFKPETFYLKNATFLNNQTKADKMWYARHTLDATLDVGYGKKTYEEEVGHFKFTVRNKAVWGNPSSIAPTSTSQFKDLDSVYGAHKHYIPRHLFWIRELWLQFNIAPALGLPLQNKQIFTIGAFSFELGKGIALGDAYAVGPELVGVYTEFDVDQYAFGVKLSGDIVPDALTYDLYTAILQNKASVIGDTGEEIYGQAFGGLNCPERGFGHINFIVAGKFDWTLFDNERMGSLVVEPYGLYNNDPEQRVQFLADASWKLGTVGLNVEYEVERFAIGFDYAQNFGQQLVKGWDRNDVTRKGIPGTISPNSGSTPVPVDVVSQVNSEIFYNSPTGPNVAYVKGSDTQKIIDASRDDEILGVGSDKEQQNGMQIGFDPVSGMPMYNGLTRFRNAYANTLHGWMFVTDASVWAFKRDLQFSVAAGVASGDENPNYVTKDGTYDGFISLQEIYSGHRVKSVFLMGGAGKVKRPLAVPTIEQRPNIFASSVSGFSNIIFTGVGTNWKPENAAKKFNLHPNVIAYWQQKPTKAFDLKTLNFAEYDARTYLGMEANVFFNYQILKDLRFYVVASSFFPGTFYEDIRGLPLNAAQLRVLQRVNRTADSTDMVPNFNTDIAYTFNIGLDYKF